MKHHAFDPSHLAMTRREFLQRCGMGMGALGLAQLLGGQRTLASDSSLSPLALRQPHFQARAKRVIHIFANGGPSHVDSF
ncbi:MAG: twin-arginine translocation signal domain-containing protein, partial [Verrucomicrobia bacterium]|nr:twin-arginine translocation signal domain-containing protein [Verrucomicrobiota bacterium]